MEKGKFIVLKTLDEARLLIESLKEGNGKNVSSISSVIVDRDISKSIYKQLREIIGGYLECVYPLGLVQPYVMVVDEEGLIKEKSLNPIGTALYSYKNEESPIVGTAVILKMEKDVFGELDFAPLNEEDLKIVDKLIQNAEDEYIKRLGKLF